MGWESHPPTAEGTMCVVSCARKLYSILLGYPQIRTSYLEYLWPLSIVLSPSKDPPRLASSSSSQELASIRGRWGSKGEEGED